MRIKVDELARILRTSDKEKFIQSYPAPFMLQMRNYQFTRGQAGQEVTAPIDMDLLKKLRSQTGKPRPFPQEVIHLAIKRNKSGEDEVISIGRAPHNDVVLDSPLISRTQVLLRNTKPTKSYQITDAGSTNENYVNFESLKPQKWYTLDNGDVICLGGVYHFVFYYPDMMYSVLKSYLEDSSETKGATAWFSNRKPGSKDKRLLP